jgi:ribosomal protein L7/L12
MSNIYAQAIDLVFYSEEKLLAAVAVEVAKASPSSFLKGYEAVKKTEATLNVEQTVRTLVISGEPVKAIKLYREAYGVDLGTAKRFVDRIRDEVRQGAPQLVNG